MSHHNFTSTLYIVTDYTFLQFFQQYGEVVDSIVLLDRRTKRSRGFGFVTFADEVCSFCALQCLSIHSSLWSFCLTLHPSLYPCRVSQMPF